MLVHARPHAGLGDICSVIAIPFISYAVAYPILQCALLISGSFVWSSWGVVVVGCGRGGSGQVMVVVVVVVCS